MSSAAPARLLIALALGCLLLALGLRASGADQALFLAINDAAWRWAPPALLSGATILGNGLCATMLLAPTLPRTPAFLLSGLYATPVALLLSRLPKALIDSPRPAAILDPDSVHVVGMRLAGHNSLPSGHALTAFVVVAVLLAGDPAARPRVPTAIAIVLAGVAVGLSRIAVGVHWPSDALAGAALGLLAGLCGVLARRRWPLPPRPWIAPLLALVVLACAAALARSDTGYPLAQPLQLALAGLGAAAAVVTLWRAWSARPGAPRPPA